MRQRAPAGAPRARRRPLPAHQTPAEANGGWLTRWRGWREQPRHLLAPAQAEAGAPLPRELHTERGAAARPPITAPCACARLFLIPSNHTGPLFASITPPAARETAKSVHPATATPSRQTGIRPAAGDWRASCHSPTGPTWPVAARPAPVWCWCCSPASPRAPRQQVGAGMAPQSWYHWLGRSGPQALAPGGGGAGAPHAAPRSRAPTLPQLPSLTPRSIAHPPTALSARHTAPRRTPDRSHPGAPRGAAAAARGRAPGRSGRRPAVPVAGRCWRPALQH